MITIDLFQKKHQGGVDRMMDEIASEFVVPIFSPGVARKSSLIDAYWIACVEDEVIGSIGVLRIENNHAVLRRFFIKKVWRGKEIGLATQLLQKVLDWCVTENVNHMYLGTMNQFKAAQKFYERNGFEKVLKSDLPGDFMCNPIDDVFYKIEI